MLSDISSFLTSQIDYIVSLLTTLPLELFIFIGSLLEEILAPIPSPFINTAAGSAAFAKEYPLIALLALAIIGSFGKLIGSYVVYKIADISEDIIIGRFGKLLGVDHGSIEKIGGQFGRGKRDWLILIGLRALPIVPSAPISVVCGIIKLPLVVYLGGSFMGNVLRSLIFLYIGYAGVSTYNQMLQGIEGVESVVKIGLLVVVISVVGYMYYKRMIKNRKKNE